MYSLMNTFEYFQFFGFDKEIIDLKKLWEENLKI